MTNKEKAQEIFKDNLDECIRYGYMQDDEEIIFMLEKMADWKENEMIEKAIEWIRYYNENGGCEFDEWEYVFRKEMEE